MDRESGFFSWALAKRLSYPFSLHNHQIISYPFFLFVSIFPSLSIYRGLFHRIYDSDGDFLLIEAAHVLPNWVTPSNSENRVSQLSLILSPSPFHSTCFLHVGLDRVRLALLDPSLHFVPPFLPSTEERAPFDECGFGRRG